MNQEKKYFIFNKDNIVCFLFKYGDGSDFSFLNKAKYPYITYEGLDTWELEGINLGDDSCHYVKFDLLEFPEFIDTIQETEKLFKENKETYSSIIKKIIDLFQKYRGNKIDLNKLRGDIGEALFLLKCIDLGIIDQLNNDNFERQDNDTFDFVIGNKSFEIKTTSRRASEIKLNYRQNKNNLNIVVVKVDYFQHKSSQEYMNILDIYNEIIKRNIKLNSFLLDKKMFYEQYVDTINRNLININEVNYYFFDNKHLPEIFIKNDSSLKDIVFVLDATSSLMINEDFEKIILKILK